MYELNCLLVVPGINWLNYRNNCIRCTVPARIYRTRGQSEIRIPPHGLRTRWSLVVNLVTTTLIGNISTVGVKISLHNCLYFSGQIGTITGVHNDQDLIWCVKMGYICGFLGTSWVLITLAPCNKVPGTLGTLRSISRVRARPPRDFFSCFSCRRRWCENRLRGAYFERVCARTIRRELVDEVGRIV